MKTILRFITNKIFIGGVIVIAQFILVLYMFWSLSINYASIYGLLLFLSALLVVYVTNRNDNPFYRLSWAIVILSFPPLGAITYFMLGAKKVPKKLRENIGEAYSKDSSIFIENDREHIKSEIPKWSGLINYIENTSNFPAYEHAKSTYLESGECKFDDMIAELEKAEHFIFLEYFIIKEGILWDRVYNVLRNKVKSGVIVRLIYDDWGCALFPKLARQCEDAGIEAISFNPLVAKLAIQMNNRNHRKICVIDSRVGYVGGMNIADEYINIGSKFGHWKDTAVKIEGDAVQSLTLMFLQFYRYYTGKIEDHRKYTIEYETQSKDLGYVIPFSDAPTDNYDLGLDAHLSMINAARDYIYIQTPYLIIGYEVTQALVLAARSGVDVRIVLPHIPDKKIVNQVTKSNYDVLLEGGVKIFEYEPGFVHSKTFVVDDEACLVGTTNMDFRSYYLHFECSILFVNNQVVADCKKDVLDTITDHCIEITREMTLETPYPVRLFRSFARIFSGLM